jgi:NitT/TauT family transport system permease protein
MDYAALSEKSTSPSVTAKSDYTRLVRNSFSGVAPLIAILGSWLLATRVFLVPPYVLPDPWNVASALYLGIVDGDYVAAAAATLTSILLGFGLGSIIGALLAILMATWRLLDRSLFPYIVAIQSMPKIAIAPLMLVWFGFGLEAKVAIVALVAAFPVLVNTLTGIRSTEHERIELIRALSGGRLAVLRRVQIPSALPYVFAGLQAAFVLAVTGAIVGEFVGAKQGIGVLIVQANFTLDLAAVFALLLLLGALAAVLNFALRLISSKIVFWVKPR